MFCVKKHSDKLKINFLVDVDAEIKNTVMVQQSDLGLYETTHV